MASDARKKKVVKKKAYPIDCELVHGASKVMLDILRIGSKGFVARVRSGICHVGIHYDCHFTLPTSVIPIQMKGQVYKTTDGVASDNKSVERRVEVLFIKPADDERLKIRTFLAATGQKE